MTDLDIYYNLIEDPDGYWIAYDLLLNHGWAIPESGLDKLARSFCSYAGTSQYNPMVSSSYCGECFYSFSGNYNSRSAMRSRVVSNFDHYSQSYIWKR
jgi:hypothetical protein